LSKTSIFTKNKHKEKMSNQVKVSKQFLLDGHKEACQSWKERIEKEAPELFEKPECKFEVGKWYKASDGGLYYYKEGVTYGFSPMSEEWDGECTPAWEVRNWKWKEVGDQEVTEVLIKEAKKRGYMEAFSVKDLSSVGGIIEVGCEKTFKPYPRNDLWLNNANENVCIFRNGKWASIIPAKDKNASLKASVKALEEQLKELKRQIG
jgi:hypothetical protein